MILGVDRIGHGILLDLDPVTLEWARRVKLPIEINLLSNIRLKAHPDYASHPFLKYLRLGLPVSLSTDDEGVLETDISNEYFLAIKNTDITFHEVKELVINSINTSFAPESVKEALLEEFEMKLIEFEKTWTQKLACLSIFAS